MTYPQRRRALLRLLAVALFGALVFSWLLYRSATAGSTGSASSPTAAMLLRLWHDQDASGTVTDGDLVAPGMDVAVTERCTGNICAAWIVTTDADGYVSIELQPGTEYAIEAPCLSMTVQAGDVGGQAVQDATTCAVWRVWLPAIAR